MKTISFGKKAIRVVKNKRSKYMRLSVSPAGEIKLTIPQFIGSHQVHNFLHSQTDWLESVLARIKVSAKLDIKSDNELILNGNTFLLRLYHNHPSVKVYLDEQKQLIHIFTPSVSSKLTQLQREQITEQLKQSLIEYARKQVAALVSIYAQMIDTVYQRISMREQSSRWGSCSSKGNLNFNWKIILAPPAVFNYVVAHEVAHLVEHNHSRAFWQLVAELQPDYREAKHWLKHNAHELEIF